MSSAVRWLDEKLYPNHARNWDDALFRERILSHLSEGPRKDVLDLGAGSGNVAQMNFRGIARRICGVDPDPRVVHNPYLDEGRVGFGESIPYGDGEFDVVFADNVFEHLPNPEQVFAEVFRVLRGGGVFLAKTPNKSHYMPTIARITSHGFHQWVNRMRGRDAENTFPTRYLANTPEDVRRLAAKTGFRVEVIDLIEGRPEYLRFSALTYLGGWLYVKTGEHYSLAGQVSHSAGGGIAEVVNTSQIGIGKQTGISERRFPLLLHVGVLGQARRPVYTCTPN